MMNAATLPTPREAERPAAYADRVGGWYASQSHSEHKKRFGQYLTPLAVAYYMAGLYRAPERAKVRILDPGAGTGILSCAVCEVLASCSRPSTQIHIEAYETDERLAECLRACLTYTKDWLRERGIILTHEVRTDDFVLANAAVLEPMARLIPSTDSPQDRFDLAILNPPYFKIPKTDARARVAASVIHGQPNIYALFMATSALLLRPGGEVICITPRSYAAGPYFRLFRERFFSVVRPETIHLFSSRQDAFRRDEVLQENIILVAQRADLWCSRVNGETVEVSSSDGLRNLHRRETRTVPVGDVFDFTSKEKVLRIPASDEHDRATRRVQAWNATMHSYGLNISTGPVVAFRATAFLSTEGSVPDTHAPLYWMQNIQPMQITWPIAARGKEQYLAIDRASHPLLIRSSNYVILRRFSAKEEPRRVTAAPFLSNMSDSRQIGLENHLNFIHRPGGSLSDEEAYGLAALFNSVLIDTYIRISSGNTQISATEMRVMPLPPLAVIKHIGREAMNIPDHYQGVAMREAIDAIVERVVDTQTYGDGEEVASG
jgi:adenine-specific DNA-methyltransferase